MLRKSTSITLVIALISTLGLMSASAQGLLVPAINSSPAEKGVHVNSAAPSETTYVKTSNEKLRSDIEKLLSNARAGKVVPTERRQMKPPQSNNLSKGAKIAIGVSIAVVVIALIVKYQKDHLFDDFRLGN